MRQYHQNVISESDWNRGDLQGRSISVVRFESTIVEFAINILRLAVLILTMAAWTVVGFVVWIPMLLRSTLLFNASILAVTISNRAADTRQLGKPLELATRFWVDGFVSILRALYPNEAIASDTTGPNICFWRAALELFWTLVVWALMLYVLRPHEMVELWRTAHHWTIK